MARLLTTGFEVQLYTTSALSNGERQNTTVSNVAAVTADTTVPRSGAACVKCAKSNSAYFQGQLTAFTGRSFWTRFAVRFSKVEPGEATGYIRIADATNTIFELSLQASKKFWSWLPIEAKHIGAEAEHPTAEANVWYVIEMMWRIEAAGKGQVQYRIKSNDGTILYESPKTEAELRNTGVTTVRIGHHSAEANCDFFFDDFAINDDTGGKQNTWPGNGKVVMLKPVATTERVGWVAGAGGTSGLFEAIDNRPPTGVKAASATNGSQIKDATNNSTDTTSYEMASYSTPVENGGGGVGGSDTVRVLMPILRGGQDSATARNIGLTVVSNPAIAETINSNAAAIAETEPTNWTTHNIAYTYDPTVEKEVKPVLKIRKATATTDNVMVDLLGLYVEYEPAPSLVLQASSGVASTSLALKAKTGIPLQASEGNSSATANLHAKTAVPLQASSGVATTSLAIHAPTTIPLGPSSGVASTSLALHTGKPIPLQSSDGVATATLALHARDQVQLQPSSGTSSTTMKLHILYATGFYIRGPSSWVRL